MPFFDKEGSLTLFSGQKRSGKTLAVAIYTLLALDQGIKGFGNFSLFLPDGKTLHPNYKVINFYDLVAIKNQEKRFVPYCILSLQEIRVWANSHRCFSDTTEFFDDLNFQGGKKGINIIGDTQLSMRADNSIRELATCRFEVEKDILGQRFIYWELDLSVTDDDVRTDECFTISFSLASLFWHRYKTYAVSKTLGEEQLQIKLQQLEPTLMLSTIKKQSELLYKDRKKFGLTYSSYCTKIRVELALMELGEQTVFSSYVADLLKMRLS